MTTHTSDTAAPDQRPWTHEMVVVHRVFRRELVDVQRYVREVPSGDTRRARVVADHLALVLGGLHHHHTGEDQFLWPLLLERCPPHADLVDVMEQQHARVEAYLERLQPMVAEWAELPDPMRGERLARLLGDLTDALLEHLDLEEREILPLAAAHLTAAEWNRMGESAKDTASMRDLMLTFAAVLEGATPDEAARLKSHLPAPARLLLATVGAWQFRRYARRLRGA